MLRLSIIITMGSAATRITTIWVQIKAIDRQKSSMTSCGANGHIYPQNIASDFLAVLFFDW